MALRPTLTLPCPDMRADLVRYEHPSGLVHWHLTTAFPQQVFALGVPTAVEESTGVAHLLEHLVLCGSERFPVGGVFHKMRARSIASYLGAMTSPVHTMYAFATPHAQDFTQLAQVCLDAAFRPLLTLADFEQEGWGWTVGSDGQPTLGGVVYNEMRGAFQNSDRLKQRSLLAALAPQGPLAHDSGGHPSRIPDLTHERLMQFHRELYDPRRCVLMTAGPLDVPALHATLDDWVPVRTGPISAVTAVDLAPVSAMEVSHPGSPATASLSYAWVLPDSHFDDDALSEWMTDALLVAPGSPLIEALASHRGQLAQGSGYTSGTGMGAAQGGWVQLNIRGHQPVLDEVLPGLMAQWQSLDEAMARGLLQPALDRIRDHLERGPELDPQPMVLLLIRQALSGRIEPQNGLAWVARMQAQLDAGQARHLIAHWVARWAGAPRTCVRHVPDDQFQTTLVQAHEARVEAYRQQVSPEQVACLVAREADHLRRREQEPDLLPELSEEALLPALVPGATRMWSPPEVGAGVAWVACEASQGLVGVRWDVAGLSDEACEALSRWSLVAMHLGTTTRDWASQARQEQAEGHEVRASLVSLARPYEPGVVAWFSVALTGPCARSDAMAQCLLDRLNPERDDDVTRFQQMLKETLARMASGRAEALAGMGLARAGAPFDPSHALTERMQGLDAILAREAWMQACVEDEGRARQELRELYRGFTALQGCPKWVVAVGSTAVQQQAYAVASVLTGPFLSQADALAECTVDFPAAQAMLRLEGPVQVHHCMQAWAVPAQGQPGLEAVDVLAKLLRERLHVRVREMGGAYGVQVSTGSGSLVALSYRDPRLDDTLRDFETALRELATTPPSDDEVRWAKVKLAQEWWRPRSAFEVAQQGLAQWTARVDDDLRRERRRLTCAVTPGDVQRAARAAMKGPTQQVAAVPVTTGPAPRATRLP